MSHRAPPARTSYTYPKLASPRSIRLIYFPPSMDADRQFSCALQEISLDSSPAFQALSYTWGDAIFPCRLVCEHQTIQITQNLYDALAQFRASGREMHIWVDAVCIDQSNDDEKSHQIPLMAEIYSKASNVIIWLGGESHGTVEAMQYLARIGKSFLDRGGPVREPKAEQTGEQGAENAALWEAVYQDQNIMRQSDVIWERSWFSRRWIIQEIAFANSAVVHCGEEQVEWDILAKAAEVLAILDGDGSQFINRRSGKAKGAVCNRIHNATKLERMRKELRASKCDRTDRQLLGCLDDARDFDCRDDKDRIFALLSIINHHKENPLTIDYAKPAAEVFQAFANYCLHNGESLEILAWAGLSNHALCGKSLQLPSWVPDWRLPFRNPNDRLRGFDVMTPSNARFRADPRFRINDSTTELSVKGILIDQIIAVCPSVGTIEEMAMEEGGEKWTLLNPSYIAVWYQALEALLRAAFESINVDVSVAVYVAGGESVWEALGRTLVLDSNEVSFDMKKHADSLIPSRDIPEDCPQPKLTDEFFSFRSIMFDTYGEFPSPIVLQSPDDQPIDSPPQAKDFPPRLGDVKTTFEGMSVVDYEYMEYLTRLVDRCQERSFFVSRTGYIGLGPKEMQHDDLICVLEGLHIPCVLRVHDNNVSQLQDENVMLFDQTEDYRAKQQLIGECYIHGFMHGEAWIGHNSEITEWTLI